MFRLLKKSSTKLEKFKSSKLNTWRFNCMLTFSILVNIAVSMSVPLVHIEQNYMLLPSHAYKPNGWSFPSSFV